MEYFLGFVIAAAVGLTGMGAGSITTPMLILFFHLTPAASVGTALTFGAVIKFAVLPFYIRRKQIDVRVLVLLCAGGVPGAVAGVYLLSILNARKYEGAIFLLLGAAISLVSLGNIYRLLRQGVTAEKKDRSRYLGPIGLVIGCEMGFSSAGAGALGGLALMNLTRLEPLQIVGTDIVFGLILSVAASSLHLSAGHYDSALILRMIVGGLPGVWAGASLSSRDSAGLASDGFVNFSPHSRRATLLERVVSIVFPLVCRQEEIEVLLLMRILPDSRHKLHLENYKNK